MTTIINHVIHCQYSGLPIAKLEVQTMAGHLPYLSHWKEMGARHPIFSLSEAKQLAFVRGEWNRLSKASEDAETTDTENIILRVGFLAVLHTLDSIVQEVPALPPLHVVQNNMNRLFALAFWHHYLDSQRFKFPRLKINKLNANTGFDNIKDYLDLCFDIKEDYENNVSELVEAEKIASAERALKALRNSWIVPVGNKQLYRWVRANLPENLSADAQGWMSTIFLGSERTILDFDKEDIELLEQIIVTECPKGNAIMFEVRKRLDKIMTVWADNKEAFSVDFEEYEEDEVTKIVREEAGIALEPPKMADFATKALFLRANATYYLQQRAAAEKDAKAKKEDKGGGL